jgi:hypothetical protein
MIKRTLKIVALLTLAGLTLAGNVNAQGVTPDKLPPRIPVGDPGSPGKIAPRLPH